MFRALANSEEEVVPENMEKIATVEAKHASSNPSADLWRTVEWGAVDHGSHDQGTEVQRIDDVAQQGDADKPPLSGKNQNFLYINHMEVLKENRHAG